MRPQARQGVLEISPYEPGKSEIPGVSRVIKLASNESAFGPSQRAVDAFEAAAGKLHLYPDAELRPLREALARKHALDAENIICANGSEALIDLLARAYAGPGGEILFSALSFPLYRIVTLSAGATPVEAPHRDFTANVDALLARATDRTKVVFLANPNNPTGTWISRREIERLRNGLPEHVLLVIDAAYAEYPESPDYSAGAEFVERGPGNVVMLRTFSKLHALANLRIGWAYAPDHVIDALRRLRLPFCVTTPAAEAAQAALSDDGHMARARSHNARWLPRLEAALREAGMKVVPSAANFAFFQVPERMGGWQAFDAHLQKAGIIARPIPPAHALRVTVGRDHENTAFLEALQSFAGRRVGREGASRKPVPAAE
ncbi:MAG: histidinol-phosphate transaminase [Alphaproteobacteria bacterium]